MGRSRGGLSSKLHVAVDALGLPVRVIISPSHRGDVLFAGELVAGLRLEHVIADRAYDANHFRLALA
nr:transposase [Acuticoccus mangrovi]